MSVWPIIGVFWAYAISANISIYNLFKVNFALHARIQKVFSQGVQLKNIF